MEQKKETNQKIANNESKRPRNTLYNHATIAFQLIEECKLEEGEPVSSETLAAIGEFLSELKDDVAEGVIQRLPLHPDESKLIQPNNLIETQNTIEVTSQNKTFYIDYLKTRHKIHSDTRLPKETKDALIGDLNKFKFNPLTPDTCIAFIHDLKINAEQDVKELIGNQTSRVEKLIEERKENEAVKQAIASFMKNRHFTKLNPTILKQFIDELENRPIISRERREKEIEKFKSEYNYDEKEYFKVKATDQVSLSERLNNSDLKPKTLLNQNVQQKTPPPIPPKPKVSVQSNSINATAQDKLVSMLAESTKRHYQLSKNQPTAPEKLHTIANEVVDLDLNIDQKQELISTLPMSKSDRDKLRNIFQSNAINDKAVSLMIKTIKNDYQLSKSQFTAPKVLHEIAVTIENSVLDQNYMKKVPEALGMRREDEKTLRDMISESLKQQPNKLQENKTDTKINGKTIDQVQTENMILLCEAMDTALGLKANKKVDPEMLSMMAEFIVNSSLDKVSQRNVVDVIFITKEDKKDLIKIMKEKTALLNRAYGTSQEPAKTNLNSTNQVSLSERLNNSDLKPKTLLNQNVQQKTPPPIPPKPKVSVQSNSINATAQDKLVSMLAESTKRHYQLSKNQPTAPEKLHTIANEVVDLDLNIDQKQELISTLPMSKSDRDKLRNIFQSNAINDKAVSLMIKTIKNDYQLSKSQFTAPKVLHEIAVTIENSVLDQNYMKKVPEALGMRREDEKTLRDMISESLKQQPNKLQENKTDTKINGKTIDQVQTENMILLCEAMDTALGLKANKKVDPEMLSMMAEFIVNSSLDKVSQRNVVDVIFITKEDKKDLIKIMKEKTALLNRAYGTSQEPAKTNLNSTNQVSLSGRLNNSDLKPKTLLDQNVQQNDHLPKKSDEFSR